MQFKATVISRDLQQIWGHKYFTMSRNVLLIIVPTCTNKVPKHNKHKIVFMCYAK